MNLPILASIIIFTLVIGRVIRKQKNQQKQEDESFWDRERRANSVRRKSLEHLNYVHIPLDSLPMDVMTDHEKVAECLDMVRTLSTQPVVNLTGYTNTDLKLEYGVANLTQLIQYDQSYTALASALQKWAECLYEAGYLQETLQILEFALSTDTDVSKTYYLLAEIYHSKGQDEKVHDLIVTAGNLRSLNSSIIVRTLQESYQ